MFGTGGGGEGGQGADDAGTEKSEVGDLSGLVTQSEKNGRTILVGRKRYFVETRSAGGGGGFEVLG